MSYYWTCPNCGNNLDPGEKCDCFEQEAVNRKIHKRNKQNATNYYMEEHNYEFISD